MLLNILKILRSVSHTQELFSTKCKYDAIEICCSTLIPNMFQNQVGAQNTSPLIGLLFRYLLPIRHKEK